MNEFVYQKTSKSDLLFNKDVKVETEVLEEGSKDLYDIIKFCCAVKENPFSPNLKEWSRKEYNSNLTHLWFMKTLPQKLLTMMNRLRKC